MPKADDIQNWAPVASASLAAIAATAAWLNVRLSRRQWLTAQRPVLVGQLVDNREKARIEFHIHNAGAGPARGVRFCLAVASECVTGYAGPNFGAMLKSDEMRVIKTELSARAGPAKGVLVCVDNTDRVHVFTLDGRRDTIRTHREISTETDPVEIMRRHHPEVHIGQLRRVGAAAIPKETTAP